MGHFHLVNLQRLKEKPWAWSLGAGGLALLLSLAIVSQGAAMSEDVACQKRDEPLPTEMQGRWVDAEDPTSELVVNGGEVLYGGRFVEYDYKLVDRSDGAVAVSLKIDDDAQEDSFERANVTGLVVTPEGEFHAYNVRFASQFVRPKP